MVRVAIVCPSGDTLSSSNRVELRRTGTGPPVTRSVAGSSDSRSIVIVSVGVGKAILLPERDARNEPANEPAQVTGSVTGSGSPRVRPDASSIAIRHRLKLPPRSLPK